MKLSEAKTIIKKETTKEREKAFFTLYGVKTQKDVMEQFKNKVIALKVEPYTNKRMGKAKVELKVKAQYQEQYISLLELLLEYSHAIFFLYSKDRINKNISMYKRIAIESIRKDNVEKAFNNLNRIYNYKELILSEEKKTSSEETIAINSNCLAIEHINTLKAELSKNDLKVKGGGSVEDKKAYMKFAIVSLATGAIASDILDGSYTPNNIIYDDRYINKLIKELREYQVERKLSMRGIRNGVDKLKLPMSESLYNKINKKYSHCRNFNHLVFLYRECKTTTPPKN